MRLTPEQRFLIKNAKERGVKKSLVAKVFGVTRKTISKWWRRTKYLKDRKRKAKESKITIKVELFILALRNTFEWGTARIQNALKCELPCFMEEKLKELSVIRPDSVELSRTSINEVLKKHKLNGYKQKHKIWKFFRADKPNELWQLDPKGPFKVQGKKYYFVICIDDYSRYMIVAGQFNHDPTVNDICKLLEPHIKQCKPEKILTDNKPFRENWDKWCTTNNIEPLHAHPYYPQDNGKVERSIRNIAEEKEV